VPYSRNANKPCFTAIRAFAIPNTAVGRNRPRLWLLQ
jgi:hypothetical protein